MTNQSVRSSIDLGTNTCLLLIEDEAQNVLLDRQEIVRLGEGVHRTGSLNPEAMKRTLECLQLYSDLVREQGGDPAQTIAVATASARGASNGIDFFKAVEQETGFKFRVITGEQEARASFVGALMPEMDSSASVVIDIGGGSTEFATPHSGISCEMGSVRLTEKFLKSNPPTDAEFWACREAIDGLLEPVVAQFAELRAKGSKELQLVGVAGTVVSLAAWFGEVGEFDPIKLEAITLTRGDLHRMVEELKFRTIEERRQIPFMEPKRADVILAGAMILWRAMEKIGFKDLKISTRGLRYGVLRGAIE